MSLRSFQRSSNLAKTALRTSVRSYATAEPVCTIYCELQRIGNNFMYTYLYTYLYTLQYTSQYTLQYPSHWLWFPSFALPCFVY